MAPILIGQFAQKRNAADFSFRGLTVSEKGLIMLKISGLNRLSGRFGTRVPG